MEETRPGPDDNRHDGEYEAGHEELPPIQVNVVAESPVVPNNPDDDTGGVDDSPQSNRSARYRRRASVGLRFVTAYQFWGGPQDGESIDDAEHETPDDYLGPQDMPIVNGKLEGLYVLNDAENGYVWTHGPWSVASDDPSATQEPTE